MPFIPLDAYPEFKVLQDHHQLIADELVRVLARERELPWMPWLSDAQGPDGRAAFLSSSSGDWTIFPICSNSPKAAKHIPFVSQMTPEQLAWQIKRLEQLFPKTCALLHMLRRVNFAGFSRLKAHSELQPHRHNNLGALILHVGIVIPTTTATSTVNACGLAVGDDTHAWTEPGQMVIFNDANIHRAWNHTDRDRVVLYVDFACDDIAQGLAPPRSPLKASIT